MCLLDKRHNYLREGGCVGAHFSTAGLQSSELTHTPAIRWRQREVYVGEGLGSHTDITITNLAYKQTVSAAKLSREVNC